jgi:CRP/FNR family cyclic AMP-dependent transcriptional regulator
MSVDAKKNFLVIHADSEQLQTIVAMLKKNYPGSQIYSALDGVDGLQKAKNTPPHVVLTDLELPKLSGQELIRVIVKEKSFAQTAVVVLSDIPDQEGFIDDVVNGRIHFLCLPATETQLVDFVNKALTFSMNRTAPDFKLKFVRTGDLLFREGDTADCAYLLKRGKLRAFHRRDPKSKTLGEVLPGEFVGEMAHINGEPRSADVEAIEDSELIEIPLGALDLLLFSKPAWSKALMKTLSRRLKAANQAKKD